METEGKIFLEKITENVGKVIVGKEKTVKLMLTAMLADGHILLEDVPGTGKTKLAKSIAKSLNISFSRIQFTPDLLPSDITGINVFNRKENDFVLRKGPVFTNILLADEINRATPRTQAGLLECMEERQVTIDGETLKLDAPFFVIATQNPIESAGTFNLPEAELDRFVMKLSVGLPDKDEEIDILNKYMGADPLDTLTSVADASEFMRIRKSASEVKMQACIPEYIADIAQASRNHPEISLGVSTRGSIALMRCAKAYAYISGRDFVVPDDVKDVAVPVLAHRIKLGIGVGNPNKVIAGMMAGVKVPTEDFSK
ncbi:MAG: MoxR family ATPase [Lachnospiraceae bacterium]|nr:MoxR family ATPase [Lachnospiraceae bacterium]